MRKENKMAMKKKTAKKAVTKKPATPKKKSAKAAPEKAAPKVESLQEILDEADKAFTDIVKRYYALGRAYVKAVNIYGAEGRRAFKARFPLTDNTLRNLELVGRGKLLPHFSLCSNRFTCGLANMADSLLWQNRLLGISKNGMVRIRTKDGIVEKPFEDFSNGEIDGVLSIVAKGDEDLSLEQLSKKLEKMRSEARAHFHKESREPYRIENGPDGVKVVKFYKAVPYTIEGLEAIIAKMK